MADDAQHEPSSERDDVPLSLIDAAGDARTADGLTMPSTPILLGLHRRMVLARRFDVQTTALTRQGRLATYPSALGQEACEVGAVTALTDRDWLFPTYRESIALLTRGVPPAEILSFFRGDWHLGFDPKRYCSAALSTPLATQALHAVGFATAAQRAGDGLVTLAFLGDGSTSEGDAHEAFNFASVWNAPVIFLVQNNGWAISVPYAKQAKARSLADRAIGYAMPGLSVDGNDAAAVYAAVAVSAERARTGGGPTLIEGVTYRMEAHTNSDDPTRYRSRDDEAAWRGRDPIERLATYLRRAGALPPRLEHEVHEEAEALAAETREAMNTAPSLDPLELFDHVYAAPRADLVAQRAALAAELSIGAAS